MLSQKLVNLPHSQSSDQMSPLWHEWTPTHSAHSVRDRQTERKRQRQKEWELLVASFQQSCYSKHWQVATRKHADFKVQSLPAIQELAMKVQGTRLQLQCTSKTRALYSTYPMHNKLLVWLWCTCNSATLAITLSSCMHNSTLLLGGMVDQKLYMICSVCKW